jgi:hypothetical protein
MKATLHAPAPWTINRISRWHDGTPKDFDYLEVNSLEGYRVAFAWDCKPKSFATMNLIAKAPDLLFAAKCALADLEGIMPEFEPSGDREHPAWETINLLKKAIK